LHQICWFDPKEIETYNKERGNQDVVLGMLLIKSDLWNLKWLDRLPEYLEEQGLDTSWCSLMYALGYEDIIREKSNIPVGLSSELMKDNFLNMLDQPANKDIPDGPELLVRETVIMKSYVMGCEVKVEAVNNPVSISLGEVLLGTLEALLSTCLDYKVMPLMPELTIKVYPSEFQKGMPEFVIDEDTGGEIIKVRHPKILSTISHEERKKFHDWIANFMIETMCQIIYVSDLDSFLQSIINEEYGMQRGIDFSDVDLLQNNLLGTSPKLQIADWKAKVETKKYTLIREKPWNDPMSASPPIPEEHKTFKWGEGEPPEELFGIDNLKHKDLRNVSLLNVPLWDKANWGAILYITEPGNIPMMALGFSNIKAAISIFKGLIKRLGNIDANDLLRISIITGVSKKYPSNYRVSISTDLETIGGLSQRMVSVSRSINMEPKDRTNLDYFLEYYKIAGKYMILPTHIQGPDYDAEPLWGLGIVKQKLNIREAWEIGTNDQDVVAIHENDDPIIPVGVKDAPVIQSLQRFSAYNKKRKRH